MSCKIGHFAKPDHSHTVAEVLAIIPARGGSKRLPGKNLLHLHGRPLLAYSILAARASRYITHTVVTSDSPEILYTAAQWGAEVVERTPEQASDEARSIDTVYHAMMEMEARHQGRWDYVAILQASSVLRRAEEIDSAILLCTPNEDGCLTVDRLYPKLGTSEDGYFRPQYEPGIRKQDMRPVYRENGVIYIVRRDLVLEGRLFGDSTRIIESPPEQSLGNIDFQWELDVTESIFDKFKYREYFNRLEKRRGLPAKGSGGGLFTAGPPLLILP